MNIFSVSPKPVRPDSSDPREVEAYACERAAADDFVEAIAALSAENRRRRNPQWERQLADWRYLAYARCPPTGSFAGTWPPALCSVAEATEFGGVIPEIAAAQLDVRRLLAGLQWHGALLVRGLVGTEVAQFLADGIRQAMQAQQIWASDGDTGALGSWYSRLGLPKDCAVAAARPWVESAGGVLLADSPRMLFDFIQIIEASGVPAVIADYFGERPLLSVGKSTLRCVPHTIRLADWHQDGAFMGADIRSINVWLSLSHCGVDASGLEYVPRRFDRVLETGTHGAKFSWSVGSDLVEREARGISLASPIFKPGDALLFDHYLLHRTGIPPGIRKDRYAIESWFFAPSAYPSQQIPLMI